MWSCASGNPGPAFHPNGTLFAAMRHNPCWKEGAYTGRTREHIGLWRADDGWNGTWEVTINDSCDFKALNLKATKYISGTSRRSCVVHVP